MPNVDPMKVSISPKAINTELCISPKGLTIKPAISSPHPTITSSAEQNNWNDIR